MKDEIFEKYRDAGEIAAKILRKGAKEIREGVSYLEVVESIEVQVSEEGAALAFPLNLSLNEDAAHDTASAGDVRVFSRGDVAKLDLGVQIDGYIADTATTIDLGNNTLLLEASDKTRAPCRFHCAGSRRPGGSSLARGCYPRWCGPACGSGP